MVSSLILLPLSCLFVLEYYRTDTVNDVSILFPLSCPVSSCLTLSQEYGIYALAGSVLLTMMGVSLMFEKNLIRLGNVSQVHPPLVCSCGG